MFTFGLWLAGLDEHAPLKLPFLHVLNSNLSKEKKWFTYIWNVVWLIKTPLTANWIFMFTVIINPNKQIVQFLVNVWTNLDRMTVWKQYFTIWKDRKKWGVRGLFELWKFNVTCWEWIAQSSWNIPHSNGLGQSLVYSLSMPISPFLSASLCLSYYFFQY